MAKKKIVIAEGEFKMEPGSYGMLYTEKISPEEMEDRLAQLNHRKGELIFVPKS